MPKVDKRLANVRFRAGGQLRLEGRFAADPHAQRTA
jgi:hypothetical protein